MFDKLFGKNESPLIEAAFNDVSAMLKQGGRMFDLAIAALLENETLEEDLEHMDDFVDQGERMVRRSVLEHLAVNPDQKLVPSLLLVSMVQDAERIGDFARGLEALIPLARSARQGDFSDRLRKVASDLRPLFDECEAAFRDGDVDRARAVLEATSDLNEKEKAFIAEIAASDLTADMAVVYSSAAQFLRRIGGHLGNIASCVVQPYDRIRHDDE